MDKMAVLTMPAIQSPSLTDDELQAHRQHRQQIIQTFGVWLRDTPHVTARKGKLTASIPKSVWMQFQVEGDQTWYSVYFPGAMPDIASLWMRAGKWTPLMMYPLNEYGGGKALAEAVMAFLDSQEMDVIHRWRDGE